MALLSQKSSGMKLMPCHFPCACRQSSKTELRSKMSVSRGATSCSPITGERAMSLLSSLEVLRVRALTLAGGPLTHMVPLSANHRDRPAAELKQVGPLYALPHIRLFSGDLQPWDVRRDLLGSRSIDRHFVAEMEDDGRARVRFGDNEHGMRPKTSSEFGPSIEKETGRREIPARTTRHVVDAGRHSIRAESPDSVGRRSAREPEAGACVRTRGIQGARAGCHRGRLRADGRAPSRSAARCSDVAVYGELVHRVPHHRQAGRAGRRRRWRLRALDAAAHGPIPHDGHDLEIRDPRFVPLDIEIAVCVEPEHFRGEIQLQLERQRKPMLADGRPGFFHPIAGASVNRCT